MDWCGNTGGLTEGLRFLNYLKYYKYSMMTEGSDTFSIKSSHAHISVTLSVKVSVTIRHQLNILKVNKL